MQLLLEQTSLDFQQKQQACLKQIGAKLLDGGACPIKLGLAELRCAKGPEISRSLSINKKGFYVWREGRAD